MLHHPSLTHYLVLILFLIGVYYFFVLLAYNKKLSFSIQKLKPTSVVSANEFNDPFPFELIDRPAADMRESTDLRSELEEADFSFLELVKDDESILLIEAEQVVEKIQHTIKNIGSNPPNPDKIKSKISAILRDYSIFENTEYFDSINSFISISVERDCQVELNLEQVLTLWQGSSLAA